MAQTVALMDVICLGMKAWSYLAGFKIITSNVKSIINDLLDVTNLGPQMRNKITEVKKLLLEAENIERPKLQFVQPKPKLLKQFNPKLIDNFDESKAKGNIELFLRKSCYVF